MHLKFRNINDAFIELVELFRTGVIRGEKLKIVKKPSRYGNVLGIEEPMTITYSRPRERVLFNTARDVNPAFHLYEALWMLSGRNDVAPLVYYNKRMAEFSDDGKTLNGAYGYRWRKAEYGESKFGDVNSSRDCGEWKEKVDQLQVLINHLKANPTSRRAVLQMWNVEDDLLKIGLMKSSPLKDNNNPSYKGEMISGDPGSKDVCCNLSVLFKIRDETDRHPVLGRPDTKPEDDYIKSAKYLDMTVFNRSNDMIWGMLGANYVHFSFLQEYVAGCLGIEVGKYNQITDDLHVYDATWKPLDWLEEEGSRRTMLSPIQYRYEFTHSSDAGRRGVKVGYPLVNNQATFDREVQDFVRLNDGKGYYGEEGYGIKAWSEPFLNEVARPLIFAFHAHKLRDYEKAKNWAARIESEDWKIVMTRWLERRLANFTSQA